MNDVDRRRVLVFGAGLGGLTAALTAVESGAQVILFEKASVAGGSTVLSGGLIWTFADQAEMERTIPDGNPILQDVVFSTVDAGRRWLADLGVRFTTAEANADCAHAGWATMTGEPGIQGLGQQMEPPQLIDVLMTRFRDGGGTLRFECALDSLLTDCGRVVGAMVTSADGRVEPVSANAVVLATGGFQGNPELLRRYVLDSPANVYLRSNSWSTGDAMLAAIAIGAGVSAGLDSFYGHAMAAPPATFRPIGFGEVTQGYGQAAVALNLLGRRFTDESLGTGEEVLNQRLARQPEGRGFYVIDQALARTARDPGKPVTQVVVDRARSRGGNVIVAGSVVELAERLGSFGVPSAVAAESLTEYDRVCAAGGASSGTRGDPGRERFRFRLSEPPFYAVEVKASITSTFGGLAVDDEMQVLRRSGSSSLIAQSVSDLRDHREVPVLGLYAVGGDVGNVSGVNYLGGLATALTTGRVAGRNAATSQD